MFDAIAEAKKLVRERGYHALDEMLTVLLATEQVIDMEAYSQWLEITRQVEIMVTEAARHTRAIRVGAPASRDEVCLIEVALANACPETVSAWQPVLDDLRRHRT